MNLLTRIGFTIPNAWKHRKTLRQFNHQIVPTFTKLNASSLKAKVLVLDMDGVLTPHGELQLSDTITQHLNHLIAALPNTPIFILSNQPLKSREDYFHTYFPSIRFITAPKMKPYPDGLLLIAEQANVAPNDMLLVDDRLLTGGLAAAITGTQFLLVEKPLRNQRNKPFKESFISSLRWIERRLLNS